MAGLSPGALLELNLSPRAAGSLLDLAHSPAKLHRLRIQRLPARFPVPTGAQLKVRTLMLNAYTSVLVSVPFGRALLANLCPMLPEANEAQFFMASFVRPF